MKPADSMYHGFIPQSIRLLLRWKTRIVDYSSCIKNPEKTLFQEKILLLVESQTKFQSRPVLQLKKKNQHSQSILGTQCQKTGVSVDSRTLQREIIKKRVHGWLATSNKSINYFAERVIKGENRTWQILHSDSFNSSRRKDGLCTFQSSQFVVSFNTPTRMVISKNTCILSCADSILWWAPQARGCAHITIGTPIIQLHKLNDSYKPFVNLDIGSMYSQQHRNYTSIQPFL